MAAWFAERYLFGDGLRLLAGTTSVELIPYRNGAGGEVAGHAIVIDLCRHGWTRVPGPIAAAVAVAEAMLAADAGDRRRGGEGGTP